MRDLISSCRPYREHDDPDYVPGEPPAPSLEQSRRIWVSVRRQLLGDRPDPPEAESLRRLLLDVSSSHRDRILTLYGYMRVLPPHLFAWLARRCGWSPGWEQYGIEAHLAILAVVLVGLPDAEDVGADE